MVSQQELRVLLTGDNSDLKAAVDGAESRLEQFGNVAGGALKVAGAAAAAFVGASSALIGMGVKIASDLEQAEASFTTLLKSGERAKAFLEDLKQFSLETPFDLPSLTAASQRLIVMGVEASQVVPLLRSVGDAVTAVGGGSAEMESVAAALAKIQQTGQLTGRELSAITSAGIPAFELLATKLGVDVPTAMQAVQDGAVDAGTFIAAFMEGTAERFSGAMARQEATLAGTLSNAVDEIKLQLAGIAEPLITAFAPIIPVVGGAIAGLLAEVGPVMADVVLELVKILAELVPAVMPIVKLIGDAIKQLLPIVKPVLTAIAALIPPLTQVMVLLLPPIINIVEALATLLVPVIELLAPLLVALMPLFEALVPILDAVALIIKALAPAFAALGSVVKALAPVINLLALVLTPIAPLLVAITPLIELLAKVLGFVVGIVAGFVGALANLALALTGNEEAWEAYKEAVRGAAEKVREILHDVFGPIVDFFKDTWAAVKLAFEIGWDRIKDLVFDLVRPLVDGIKALFDLVGWFRELGGKIIDGLVQGLRDAWENTKGIVGDIGNGIKDAFTGALGISSPSRVFMGYGEDIVEGLRQGMDGLNDAIRVPMVEASLPDIGSLTAPTMGGGRNVFVTIHRIDVPLLQATPELDMKALVRDLGVEVARELRESLA